MNPASNPQQEPTEPAPKMHIVTKPQNHVINDRLNDTCGQIVVIALVLGSVFAVLAIAGALVYRLVQVIL